MMLLASNSVTAGVAGPATDPGESNRYPVSPMVSSREMFVVNITVNGRLVAENEIVMRESRDVWVLPDALLASLGVSAPGKPVDIGGITYWRIEAGTGISLHYDKAVSTLSCRIAARYFEGRNISARVPPAQADTGETVPALFLDYDIGVLEASGDSTIADGAVDLGVSGAFGVAQSQWMFSTAEGDRVIRLGTSLTIDDVDRRTTLVLGDGVEAAAPGLASLPYGGVAWYSNFETDPDFITFPLPVAQGIASSPGRLNVFANDQPVYAGEIGEGEFSLSDIPVTAGAGQLRIVTSDLMGRETVLLQPYYVTTDLLAPGLTAFTLAAGRDRLEFGADGIRYGSSFIRGGIRRGIADWMTLGAAAETSGDVADATLGADWRLGTFGIASLGVAGSRQTGEADTGFALTGSMIRSAGQFSFGLRIAYKNQAYEQIGVPGQQNSRTQYDGYASRRVGAGTFTASAFWLDVQGADDFGVARLGYSVRIGRGQFTLAGMHLVSDGGASEFGLTYSLPLGAGNFVASHIATKTGSDVVASLEAGHSPPEGLGMGYDVGLDTAGGDVDGRARINIRQTAYETWLDAAERGKQTAIRARLRGGFAFADDRFFAARDIEKGALLIETPDLENVPVRLNHRDYGRTRKDGYALIPVQPFLRQTIGIDDGELPIDLSFKALSQVAVTSRGRVTRVRFSLANNFSQSAIIQLANGSTPPRGTVIAADGDPVPLPVGHDGLAYLTSQTPERRYAITTGDGSCSFDVDFTVQRPVEAGESVFPVYVCR